MIFDKWQFRILGMRKPKGGKDYLGPRLEIGDRDPIPIIDRCTMGRHPNNAIVFDHKKISRWHAAIVRLTEREFRLMDFDTTNGTWLNGRRISDPAILADGDMIQIGHARFVFRGNQHDSASALGLDTTIAESAVPADDDESYQMIGHGIISLGADGEIQAMTEAVRQWLGTFFDPHAAKSKNLPGDVAEWLEEGLNRLSEEFDAGMGIKPFRKYHGTQRLSFHLKSDHEQRQTLLLITREDPLFDDKTLVDESMEIYGLTRRQAETLYYLVEGKTNPEIAIILGCSRRTIEAHLREVYRKMGVETRSAAMSTVLMHFRNKKRPEES